MRPRPRFSQRAKKRWWLAAGVLGALGLAAGISYRVSKPSLSPRVVHPVEKRATPPARKNVELERPLEEGRRPLSTGRKNYSKQFTGLFNEPFQGEEASRQAMNEFFIFYIGKTRRDLYPAKPSWTGRTREVAGDEYSSLFPYGSLVEVEVPVRENEAERVLFFVKYGLYTPNGGIPGRFFVYPRLDLPTHTWKLEAGNYSAKQMKELLEKWGADVVNIYAMREQ